MKSVKFYANKKSRSVSFIEYRRRLGRLPSLQSILSSSTAPPRVFIFRGLNASVHQAASQATISHSCHEIEKPIQPYAHSARPVCCKVCRCEHIRIIECWSELDKAETPIASHQLRPLPTCFVFLTYIPLKRRE